MKRRHEQSGFTLIELVLASALAAILMAGMLSVLAGITRDRERLARLHNMETPDRAAIIQLIRRDLSCATNFQGGENELTVHTYSSLDVADSHAVDRPSEVTYSLLKDQGMWWLIRRQQFVDEPVPPRPVMNLVACGVTRFNENELLTTSAQGSLSSPTIATRRVAIEIDFDDPKAKIEQTICLP